MIRQLRVGAYAVCHRDGADGRAGGRPGGEVLLARWISPQGPRWTLPGGGVDHGEDPADAAVREVREETGYTVRLDGLLTVDSLHAVFDEGAEPVDHHGVRIVYRATVTGGELAFEQDGTTDMAAWVPLAQVAELDRVSLVDVALEAAQLS